MDELDKRKVLMDRFRAQNAALRTHVEQRTQDGLERARWTAFGFVMLFGGSVLSLGMVVVERQARRDGARREQRREFIDALQGADDELEAKELLADHQVQRRMGGEQHGCRRRSISGGCEDGPVARETFLAAVRVIG